MIEEHQMLEIMAPLVPIVRDREALFIEALAFVNRNIESSSNDFDQIYIFGKFLEASAQQEIQLAERETELLGQVTPSEMDPLGLVSQISSSSKEMMRLSGRLLEILQNSVDRVRKSLFGENGKLSLNFARFKKNLHRMIREDFIDLTDFTKLVIAFCRIKYRKQISKLKSYLKRLENGDHVSLKELYSKQASDTSVSPEDRSKSKNKLKTSRKSPQLQQSESESPQHKASSKKVSLTKNTKTRKTLNLKAVKKQQTEKDKETPRRPSKSSTAAKLLKYYNIMEITKKEFLEDYIFQVQAEEQQRKKLMNSLMDRNKQNIQQIKGYCKKCEKLSPLPVLFYQASSEESPSGGNRNHSAASKKSFKTSFVISKRKPSFTFQSPSERSDAEIFKEGIQMSRTIKNFTSRKRQQVLKGSQSRTKQLPHKPSKKIFVAKSPMIFEDDIIPKAEISTRAWIQTPLTGRQKARRNENIRLKRQSNPCPLDGTTLGNSFHFTQYPV